MKKNLEQQGITWKLSAQTPKMDVYLVNSEDFDRLVEDTTPYEDQEAPVVRVCAPPFGKYVKFAIYDKEDFNNVKHTEPGSEEEPLQALNEARRHNELLFKETDRLAKSLSKWRDRAIKAEKALAEDRQSTK